jgi:CBS domain containing-hemolysin-like protein
MNTIRTLPTMSQRLARPRWLPIALLAALMPASAYASFLSGDALDTAADVMTWVVLVVAPVVAIGVFLLVHILPEKIAEKKRHPQVQAIQTLCLLSLVFGGMLWPAAWLWAFSKPVLYKMAYGKDTHDDEPGEGETELERLRRRVAELEGGDPPVDTAAGAGRT